MKIPSEPKKKMCVGATCSQTKRLKGFLLTAKVDGKEFIWWAYMCAWCRGWETRRKKA